MTLWDTGPSKSATTNRIAFDPASMAATRVKRPSGCRASQVLDRKPGNLGETVPVTSGHAITDMNGRGSDDQVMGAHRGSRAPQLCSDGCVNLDDFVIERDHRKGVEPCRDPGLGSRSNCQSLQNDRARYGPPPVASARLRKVKDPTTPKPPSTFWTGGIEKPSPPFPVVMYAQRFASSATTSNVGG